MRGTLADDGEPCFTPGIIPAYAGNTCELWRDAPSEWGSSPRMRGTQQLSVSHGKLAGIIPAYAGNTLARACI